MKHSATYNMEEIERTAPKKTNGISTIELLAPAKNLEQGLAAIDHGADAVYIGADEFGARQAAGNSIDDIAKLAIYAHKFGARVYVTFNTIIFEQELDKAKNLLREIIKANADAILVQDMAIVEFFKELVAEPEMASYHIPELHASTQTDNRNTEKVKWLRDIGFSRVVLARELSLNEIRDIHKAVPDVELEVFVHGALCVSYSGACYASHHCFGRSANRGECAQFCRLAFDLQDSNGQTIKRNSHLLSLKDLNQVERIGEIIESGVSSLKIEGRLKDATYVKNVVAAYSNAINNYISKNTDRFARSSYGSIAYSFTPQLSKTFNRGFTHYFLDGRRDDISSFDTPKAMGEYVGYVKEIRRDSFNVAGTASFANGDGLCFFTTDKKLEGFRVNKAANNRIYPLTMPRNLRPGMGLYRNKDIDFDRAMSANTAERKLTVDFTIGINDNKIILTAQDEIGRNTSYQSDAIIQPAQKPQGDNITRQLGKLGNTVFKLGEVCLKNNVENTFIPSSHIAAMRRIATEALENKPINIPRHKTNQNLGNAKLPLHQNAKRLNIANVSNRIAESFYKKHGIENATCAVELTDSHPPKQTFGKIEEMPPLMTCRYCLRHAMGYCIKRGGQKPSWKEPLFLVSSDGRRVRLVFNCSLCQMEVYAAD